VLRSNSITDWIIAAVVVARCQSTTSPYQSSINCPEPAAATTEQLVIHHHHHSSIARKISAYRMPLHGDGLAAGISSAAKRPISDNHSPAVASPARIATPPPPSERRYSEARTSDYSRHGRSSIRTSELNTEAVDHALRREINRQQREGTPGSSPHRKRQRINGDRYAHACSWNDGRLLTH
jgi:hypothetical protein